MSTLRDQLLKTAQLYLDGLNDPGPDASGLIAHRTADCTQRILPKNLNQPTHTNETYFAFMCAGAAFVKSLKFALDDDPMVDEVARKVMLHMSSDGETVAGPYNNEYFIVLSMTEDGTKIKEITEFLDSRTFLWVTEAIQKVIKESQEQA